MLLVSLYLQKFANPTNPLMKDLQIDDIAVASNIRQGDKASLTMIYQRYHQHLYRFALRFLKSPEHAEELVHDVFLKLWENRDRLNEECSLKGYLIKTCKSHIVTLLTRASAGQAISGRQEVFR